MNFFKKASSGNQGEDTWNQWIQEDKQKKLEQERQLKEEEDRRLEDERKRIEAMTPEQVEAEAEVKRKEKDRCKQIADDWKNYIISQLDEHKYAIYREQDELSSEDAYGNIDNSFWDDCESLFWMKNPSDLDSNGFNKGFNYFFKNVLLRDRTFEEFFDGQANYYSFYKPKDKSGKENSWILLLMSWTYEYAIHPVAKELDYLDLDRAEAGFDENMSGEEYEVYCGNILVEAGWNVELTSTTNDQGVDLVAQIEDIKICIQCKRYSNPVGNKAVQEIIAGTQFYGGTHAVVVSNAGFTKSARELADSTGVLLISDIELKVLEDFVRD